MTCSIFGSASPVCRLTRAVDLNSIVRRGVTLGGQGLPVTLGYSENGGQPPEVAVPGAWYRVGRASLGLLRAPQKPHNSATRCLIPQESHGRNGTLRYTCYAC